MGKEVTIYDIAKELSLSPSTISRALSDHPAVKRDTKLKVFKMASQLGYRSNMFASNLRKQRTNTLGVIVPKLDSNVMASVLAGMEKVVNVAGYTLLISQSLESVETEIANAKAMFNSRVDGLLVSLAFDTDSVAHFEPFISKGIPVIFYDRVAVDHKECIGVVIDNIQAAYKATAHLVEQGCKRIVNIAGNLKRNVYSDRLKGFRYALVDHGLPFSDRSVIVNDLSEKAGEEAARQILEMDPRPDGVFVSNDICAVHCMKALMQAGVRIPEEIAVVGFNNDPISEIVEPSLTTVDYPCNEMGEVAVRTMLNQLSGSDDHQVTSTITLRADLVVRGSSLRSGPCKRAAKD